VSGNASPRPSHDVPPGRPLAPVVHISWGEGRSSIFMSQVARPMSLLLARGRDVLLVATARIGEFVRPAQRRHWERHCAELHNRFGMELHRFPMPPSRMPGLWSETGFVRRWLMRRFRQTPRVVLHCMNTEAALIGLSVAADDARFSVVYDARGIEGPEYLMYAGYQRPEEASAAARAGYEARCARQGQALRASHAVLVTSEAMRQEFARAWDIPVEKMRAYPCCTDVKAGEMAAAGREGMRRKLGLEDRFVVAYCGNVQPWQSLPESLAIFRQISKLRADAHLLALTTHATVMEDAIKQAGIARAQCTVMSVPHTEVPAYLAAADAGLLLRAASVVNRVASPVKFAEYLACGVPVILTQGVGDYSELVESCGIGCVIPSLTIDQASHDLLQAFMKMLSDKAPELRERCLAIAQDKFDWNRSVDIMCETYAAVSAPAASSNRLPHS
jgi:glycosyltransferase involved in cell wall biosynthesis